jgi:hypothetical protein
MDAKDALFAVFACAALFAVAVGSLETPGKLTGMAITSSSNASSVNYCDADWACYGETHRGYRRADCSWEKVEACGTNSACPDGLVLAAPCNKTCSGDGVCDGCQPVCAQPTPAPTASPVPVSIEICSETALPQACAGEDAYQKEVAAYSPALLRSCKKTVETGLSFLSCPACPQGTALDNCVNVFFWLVWKSKCAQTQSFACGEAGECPSGFGAADTPCEKRSAKKNFCCKKFSKQ